MHHNIHILYLNIIVLAFFIWNSPKKCRGKEVLMSKVNVWKMLVHRVGNVNWAHRSDQIGWSGKMGFSLLLKINSDSALERAGGFHIYWDRDQKSWNMMTTSLCISVQVKSTLISSKIVPLQASLEGKLNHWFKIREYLFLKVSFILWQD